MPRAPARNQKQSEQQKLKPSESLVEYNNEAKALVKAEQTGVSLVDANKALRTDAAHRLRGRRHDLTTNKGVVSFLNEAINSFVLGPTEDGDGVGRNELNTLGYVCGIQLRAIEAVQKEEKPADDVAQLLGGIGTQISITMTREERMLLLTGGSVNNMAKVLSEVNKDGRIIHLEKQQDGSYATDGTQLEEPPRRDAKIPHGDIADAMRAEGIDTDKGELKAILGPSLGTPASADGDEEQDFGFDVLYDVTAKTVPALAHEFRTVSFPNPGSEGTVIRVSQCTKCGITTKNTKDLENELCGSDHDRPAVPLPNKI